MTEQSMSHNLPTAEVIRSFLAESDLNEKLRRSEARNADLARREQVLRDGIDGLDERASAYARAATDLEPDYVEGYVDGMLAACRHLQTLSEVSRRASVMEDVQKLLASVGLAEDEPD